MADTDGGAIEAVAGPSGTRQMELAQMSSEASQEAIAAGHLSQVMETAMAGITVMPGAAIEPMAFKDQLMGDVGGEVVREKTGMVSAGDGAAQDGEGMDALVQRYEKLYTDMTVFQVAWSIARRVQQDTSQLLRGQ